MFVYIYIYIQIDTYACAHRHAYARVIKTVRTDYRLRFVLACTGLCVCLCVCMLAVVRVCRFGLLNHDQKQLVVVGLKDTRPSSFQVVPGESQGSGLQDHARDRIRSLLLQV